jgi:hypothetical protein
MTEDDVDTPFEAFWGDLLDDVEATAVEYREEGWETHALTVGDVTALYATDKPYGLDVLVPESAFELVDGLREETTFDNSEVYARTIGPTVFLLIVELASETNDAVLIPAYFNHTTDGELLDAAAEGDGMRVHVRSLGSDHRVTFRHEDYTLFEPDEDEGDAEGAETADGAASE